MLRVIKLKYSIIMKNGILLMLPLLRTSSLCGTSWKVEMDELEGGFIGEPRISNCGIKGGRKMKLMEDTKKLIYHILSQFGYLFTLYLFSSNYKQLPWYDPDYYKFFHLIISLPLPMLFSLIIGFILKSESKIEKCIKAIYPVAYLITVTYMTNMGIYGMPKSIIGGLIVFILYIPAVYFLLQDIKKMKRVMKN
ncbi:hypothetical protein D3C73_1016170 [compost metagenome]